MLNQNQVQILYLYDVYYLEYISRITTMHNNTDNQQ
jgi:hypothetical protein